jgi:hypothetical protein
MDRFIDLTKTKNYVINVDSSTESMAECKSVLDRLGLPFERSSANTTSSPSNPYGNHFVGCGLSHLHLLKSMEPGTVVFEDDIVPTDALKLKFLVPDYADAVYLGGTHAMLFLSQRYIDAAAEVIESYLDNFIPCDVALASIHKDFKVLTPNSPYFYQKDQPDLTNFTLKV